MALRFSDMTPLPSGELINKDDLFCITRNADQKTYSVKGQDIINYTNSVNNGRFRGSTTSSFDDMVSTVDVAASNVGTWNWGGSYSMTDVTGSNATVTDALVEIITYRSADQHPGFVVQRVNAAQGIWERCILNTSGNNTSPWRRIDNASSVIMDCGITNAQNGSRIDMPHGRFNGAPIVVCNVNNGEYASQEGGTTVGWVYSVTPYDVHADYFRVLIMRSQTGQAIQKETVTTTETSSTVTTKTVVYEYQGPRWELLTEDVGIYWAAFRYQNNQTANEP